MVPPAPALLAGVAISIALRLLWAGVGEQRPVWAFAFRLIADLAAVDLAGLIRDYMPGGGEDTPRAVRAVVMLPVGLSLLHIRKASVDAVMDPLGGVEAIRGNARAESEDRTTGRFRKSREPIRRDHFAADSHRFPIPVSAREALLPGVEYCIYYAVRSRTVLAAEPLWECGIEHDAAR